MGAIAALEELLGATSSASLASVELVRASPGEPMAALSSRFIARTLEAYARLPHLVELWARVSHRSHEAPVWSYAGEAPRPDRPPFDEAEIFCELKEPGRSVLVDVPGRTARCAVLTPAGLWPSRPVTVIAVFDSRAHATAAISEITWLGAHLHMGVRILRRTADSDALGRLSLVLAEAEHAEAALRSMAEIVRAHMESDGTKIYVLRRTQAGPTLVQLYRTDLPGAERKEVPVRPDRGLGDWVVNHQDWLLIPDGVAPELTGETPEVAFTGHHGWVRVLARCARDFVHGLPSPDRERSMLLVPMHSRGRVAGVLAVWRDAGDSYDVELDTTSLLSVAPHVASACERVLQIEQMGREMSAVSRLAVSLVPTTDVASAYASIATEIGRLAGADFAVLLHHDPERPGHLYLGHAWAASAGDRPELEAIAGGFHEDCGTAPEGWGLRVGETLSDRAARAGWNRVPSGALLLFPSGDTGAPRAAIWLGRHGADSAAPSLPAPRTSADRPSAAPPSAPADKLDHVSPSFLQYAGAMLENHVRAYASTVVGALGGPTEIDAVDPIEVLQRAAILLKEATHCQAALVYSGDLADMAITHCFPERPGVPGLPVARGSLTWESVKCAASRRVLDADDPDDDLTQRLDRAALDRFSSAFGWPTVRSWICCPVVHKGRCVGAIKVLTSAEGPFLGPHQEAIARSVADRAAWEIHKMGYATMLDALNCLANDIVAKGGSGLAEVMIGALTGWVDRFVRPGCELIILARVPGRTLVFRRTSGISDASAQALEALSLARSKRGELAGRRASSPDLRAGRALWPGDPDPPPRPGAAGGTPDHLAPSIVLHGGRGRRPRGGAGDRHPPQQRAPAPRVDAQRRAIPPRAARPRARAHLRRPHARGARRAGRRPGGRSPGACGRRGGDHPAVARESAPLPRRQGRDPAADAGAPAARRSLHRSVS